MSPRGRHDRATARTDYLLLPVTNAAPSSPGETAPSGAPPPLPVWGRIHSHYAAASSVTAEEVIPIDQLDAFLRNALTKSINDTPRGGAAVVMARSSYSKWVGGLRTALRR